MDEPNYVFVVQESDYEFLNIMLATTDLTQALQKYTTGYRGKESGGCYDRELLVWFEGNQLLYGSGYVPEKITEIIEAIKQTNVSEDHIPLVTKIVSALEEENQKYLQMVADGISWQMQEQKEKDYENIRRYKQLYPDFFLQEAMK